MEDRPQYGNHERKGQLPNFKIIKHLAAVQYILDTFSAAEGVYFTDEKGRKNALYAKSAKRNANRYKEDLERFERQFFAATDGDTETIDQALNMSKVFEQILDALIQCPRGKLDELDYELKATMEKHGIRFS